MVFRATVNTTRNRLKKLKYHCKGICLTANIHNFLKTIKKMNFKIIRLFLDLIIALILQIYDVIYFSIAIIQRCQCSSTDSDTVTVTPPPITPTTTKWWNAIRLLWQNWQKRLTHKYQLVTNTRVTITRRQSKCR